MVEQHRRTVRLSGGPGPGHGGRTRQVGGRASDCRGDRAGRKGDAASDPEQGPCRTACGTRQVREVVREVGGSPHRLQRRRDGQGPAGSTEAASRRGTIRARHGQRRPAQARSAAAAGYPDRRWARYFVRADGLNLYNETQNAAPAKKNSMVLWMGYDAPDSATDTRIAQPGLARDGGSMLASDV